MAIRGEAAKSGITFGSALAIAISWSANKSILWAILHGLLGWIYVIYYALENSIRRFISERLLEKHGLTWWNDKVPEGVRNEVAKKQKEEKDPLMEYLLSFKDRMAHAKDLLTDAEKTAFFFVTLPEALPIAVITRFINWFKDFGIPVGGVIVNMLIPKETLTAHSAEFVRNRVQMQDQYMEEVWQKFNGAVRAILPLFETEVKGVEMLRRLRAVLFP